jgi:hypothetical protein
MAKVNRRTVDLSGYPDLAGFWHETYFMRGGLEAIYNDMPVPLGLLKFAPSHEARGPMFSARQRAGLAGRAASDPPLSESDLDANEG